MAEADFVTRGRLRRRLRFLRQARELAYRDLGGLVHELHRLGETREELVEAKLAILAQIDAEVRAIEESLGHPEAVTVLREAGVAPCPRCGSIHGSADRFCPGCGLALEGGDDAADTPAAEPERQPPVPPSPPAKPPAARTLQPTRIQ